MTTLHVEKLVEAEVTGASGRAAGAAPPLPPGAPPDQAVATEARKGYGLLMVGLEPECAQAGGFHGKIIEVARSFEGPIAVVAARGAARDDPSRSRLHILVPVNG